MRIGICLLILCSTAQAGRVAGSTDDAMTVGGGARPIGMGKAFTALADDADAPFVNPAGIAGIKGPQAMAMFTNLIGDVYYLEYCGAIPSPYGAVGAGYITTGVNAIPVGALTADYYDSLFLVSYASSVGRFLQYWDNVFVGLNYKLYNRGYTGALSGQGYATGQSADLGLKFILNPYLSFGLSRQNILPVSMGGVIRLNGGVEESLAGITKLGIAIKPIQLERRLTILADVDLPAQSGRPVTAHFGSEWKMNPFIWLRAGLDESVDAATGSLTSWNPTFGTSFSYAGFRVDYALHPYYNDPSLASRYLSFSYQGEPWFALKGRAE